MDRDLQIGGRVIVKNKDGGLEYKLYQSDGAIAIIPNLCIHLSDHQGNELKLNQETELRPIFATQTFENLNTDNDSEPYDQHYKGLFQDIAKKLDCKIEDIMDFDLCFADANPGQIIGFNQEFISSSRQDNLFSTWALVHALARDENMTETADINVGAMFDHEEIGSNTISGADSRKCYLWYFCDLQSKSYFLQLWREFSRCFLDQHTSLTS